MAVAIVTIMSLVALFASSALAAKTHPYTGTSFGPDGTTATSFSNLQGVAVDQASGNVFAYDAAAGKIYKFDASGAPVSFSALTGNAIEGVGGAGNGEEEIAVAPVGSPGGTAGDIYAANNSVVKIYASSGEFLGELTGGETCGVAVNPAGHVFVGVYPGTVREYVPSANPAVNGDESGASVASLPGICNVAADGLGNVYAANYSGGQGAVKLEGLSDPNASQLDPGAATLAIDPSGNDVYANRGELFAQYNSSGAPISTSGGGQLAGSRGIAVNGASETVYAGNNGSGKVDVFGAPIVVAGVTPEPPTELTGKKATLHAKVNPAGLAVSSCVFEYGPDATYGQSKPCEGALPSDEADHPVTAQLTGLTPNTEYHWRVAATNANGTNRSVDQTFTTNLPAVTREATAITATKATLNGAVFPEGDAVTDCKFEYGTSESFGQSVPCEGVIPTDEGEHPVTGAVTGLTSSTTYYFRIVATNANGTNFGTTRNLTTNQPAVTQGATNVAGTKATLNGTVFPEGDAVTDCKFEYGTSESYGSTAPCEGSIPADEGEHEVSAQLSHLAPNGTIYHFRLSITRASGTSRGGDRAFATEATVVTGGSSGVTGTTATVEGTLDPEGIAYTECAFEYGATDDYGQSAPCAESPTEIGEGAGPVPVHADLTGLTRGTTYHYRLVGTNADGAAKGSDRSFTTIGARIEAEWASSVDLTEATLKAQINPQGTPTTYHLEYGTDTSYGASTSERGVGSDESAHVVVNSLEGLTAGTTYHYRFVATSTLGVSEGPDHVFTTYSPLTPETSCPNQGFRTGASSRLPDCRAYEMVSPVDKNNGDLKSICNVWCYRAQLEQSSVNGNKLAYGSYKAFAGSQAAPYANEYLAARGPDGWSTADLNAPRDEGLYELKADTWDLEVQYKSFTPDLSTGWVTNDNVTPVTADASKGNVNLYRRDTAGDSFKALITNPLVTPGSLIGWNALAFGGNSADGSHAVFYAESPLNQEAAEAGMSGGLYDYANGELSLVSILPNGTPVKGITGTDSADEKEVLREHAVSDDGSRIFWASGSNLYVRIDGERTVPISTSGNAQYRDASADGSRALYTTDIGYRGSYGKLFEFDVDTETRTLIASQVAGVLGASRDFSYIYFVSTEDLAAGATAGRNNVYVDHDGTISFVARLSQFDIEGSSLSTYPSPITVNPIANISRVTPDGRHLAFESNRSLTGYDNTDARNGEPDIEVYVYDADDGRLFCASCNPSGARPLGQFLRIPYAATEEAQVTAEFGGELMKIWAAAWIPSKENSLYSSRLLSDDGEHLFFNSYDALVAQDANSQQDVYEWNAPGAGSCHQENGCIRLISSGESGEKSEFVDADPEGNNVFFETKSSLLPQDPGLVDIYDARVNGGFAPALSPPAACEGEACQGPLTPPNDPTPGSSSFHGAGNQVDKSAKKKSKKKAHKKKRHAKRKHRANRNGRTVR